jgi:peptide/nickel transport system ATP-binding protein
MTTATQQDQQARVDDAETPAATGTANEPRARIEDLHVTFRRGGADVRALRGVSLDVAPGEILAVVGESGSGKSVLGLSLLGLLDGDPAPIVSGTVEACGVDMISGPAELRRQTRRAHLGAVFQDPMTSLNPTMRVGRQVVEAAGSTEEARRLLELVGVPEPSRRMSAYPHELSGGLRQRVMLAMAVAGDPQLVVADEPTTALDVTVQAQILALLRDVRDEIGCSFVLITHDFGVASQVADRVAVMYGGRLAEAGRMDAVMRRPSHPYTTGLLRSRLDLNIPLGVEVATLPGEPPDPRAHPPGCAFSPRCPDRRPDCNVTPPDVRPAATHDGLVACVVTPEHQEAAAATAPVHFLPVPRLAGKEPAVRCVDVGKEFIVKRGVLNRDRLIALNRIALDVEAGESVAVVGESGSGKSTLLRVVAGLLQPDRGKVIRAGGRPQMIFQDAGASLTPWLTVGEIVGERLRSTAGRAERRRKVEQALRLVGLPPEVAQTKAKSLSGGQRQRVAFARATIVPPALLLCDEPTSALDASLAASVLNLLQRLRREMDMAVMFVTHDLAAARFVADRIAVMYLGDIVELGRADQVVDDPQHPYTKALLSAVPRPGTAPVRLPGEPASPLAPPSGCAFHPRCSQRIEGCDAHAPHLLSIDGSRRLVRCVVVPRTVPVSQQPATAEATRSSASSPVA